MCLEAPMSPRSKRGGTRLSLLSCRQVSTSAARASSYCRVPQAPCLRLGSPKHQPQRPSGTAGEGSALSRRLWSRERQSPDWRGRRASERQHKLALSNTIIGPLPPGRRARQIQLSSFRMNTYEKSPCNPRRMNTYKNTGLKVPLESTLTKKRGGGGVIRPVMVD